MRKKSEMQKANEEFVKTYDDSKYPKPSVTAISSFSECLTKKKIITEK